MRSQPQLFFSYRRTQFDRVRPVVDALKNAGIDCFFDVLDIDPLADFSERIRRGIDRSHAVLAWWSKDYVESDSCLQEFRYAWQHACRHSSDLERRIWVVNPETSAHHIIAGELNSTNFLRPPTAGGESGWARPLLKRLQTLLPEGPLADERQQQAVPVLYNVPVKSSEFTGRGRELMSIHSKLHPVRISASATAGAVQIHGMGGIGKTELAIAYVRDFAMAYPGGVYWLNLAGWNSGSSAREEEAQSAWLGALEQALGLDTELVRMLTQDAKGNALPPGAVREKLAGRLGNQASYLWILDNVPELSPLDARDRILDFIRAPTGAGHTLLTTRDGRVADGFAQEELEVLSEEDALRLLARFRPQEAPHEIDAMRELVREVGAHTQGLILLGEHARNYSGGYPRVMERLKETGRLERIEQIADQLYNLLGSKARGIVSTFALSIEPLEAAEKEILALASICAANLPIPDAVLAAAFGGSEREDAFGAALGGLLRAWLVSRRADNVRGVFIHPLVAAAAIHLLQVDKPTLRQRLADVLLKRIEAVDDIRTHAVLADEILQARELGRILEEQRGVRLLLLVGTFERIRGHYAEAIAVGKKSLELATRVLGAEHPFTLAAMRNLAHTLNAQGDLSGARALREQILSIRARVMGEEHLDTLEAKHNLALTLHAQGDLDGARMLHEQTLSIRRRVLGEEHRHTVASMNNLALTLRAQGDLGSARILQEQVLSVFRRVLGGDHPSTLGSMNNLASTLRAQGDLSGARSLEEQVLPIRRRVLGDEHPDTLNAMNNLALALWTQKDFAGSRVLQEQVLSIQRRVLGAEHPDTSVSAWNLILSLDALEDFDAAHAVLQTHLLWLTGRDPNTLGANQRRIRNHIIRNTGRSNHRSNRPTQARSLFRRVISRLFR